jgi:hypothetical protein
MTKIRQGGLLALVLVGCGSDPPPVASVAKDVILTESALARLQNVSLIRAGDSFTLAGYDSGLVQWGRLSLDGVLTPEAPFALSQPVEGGPVPVFAATQKTTPGDQLIAIAVVSSATTSGGYDLTATVQTVGATAPAAPIVLKSFPAGTDPTTVQIAAGAAASGNVGYVAWGIRVAGIPISYLTLPADAITAAAPSTMLDRPVPADVPNWDCLASANRSTGFSFSAVSVNPSGASSDFQTAEVSETGDTIFMTYPLTVMVENCRIVGSPNPAGNYYIAMEGTMQGNTAIDFATYYPPPPPDVNANGTVTTYPVLPAAVFGDPLSMPRPAWVTSAGGDIVIGLARKSGPQVVRYTYNAVPHGSTLSLRSVNGDAGPVAAWVGDDAAYITYTDSVKSGSTTSIRRYFMRIESPASLP